ncbi:dual OB domain-containing protein [Halodesulfovibrio spirochaetisodalis]|uniref:Dual OB-containing domain-containing protein n=1 Tax=Halodesulfovibrio spirochaetisodalis TaxID=1560234 RepID=A0A1B7XI75_9BACT|nr:hypothetical protein [Halodesulfovibrio spirochaetisodalis]OBQ55191.1 hypothetical protein SP90_04280 [Halodesulfovibrio spirochaetisodalis]
MKEYIVTDLTRFNNSELVCTAIVDLETNECLRPTPYFKAAQCRKINMHPGAVLQGTFSIKADTQKPHVEDAVYEQDVKFVRVASSEEFKAALDATLSESVSKGFGVDFDLGQKHIPLDSAPSVSILTLKISPQNLSIHEDQFKKGKLRLTFTDNEGSRFSFLSITDRGFHDYAMEHYESDKMDSLEEFIAKQEEVYLRIGLSRKYATPDGREGYWLQGNGIYTFPDFLPEIRQYK